MSDGKAHKPIFSQALSRRGGQLRCSRGVGPDEGPGDLSGLRMTSPRAGSGGCRRTPPSLPASPPFTRKFHRQVIMKGISPRRMKTLVRCPEAATPAPALPPPWGRGRVGGFTAEAAKVACLRAKRTGRQRAANPHQVRGTARPKSSDRISEFSSASALNMGGFLCDLGVLLR